MLHVVGGRVVRPDGRIDRADVAIDRATGTIDAIGELQTVPEETLDASGCLVVPGLVNAHTHVAMTLLRGYADDKPLHEWLEEDIFPIEAALTADDVAAGARLGILEMIKGGTTAFCDMYFHEERIAEAAIDGGVRALVGYGMITIGKDDEAIADELETGIDFATAYAGAGEGRIRTALMPHAVRTVEADVLERVASRADCHDLPIHAHISESRDDIAAVEERDGRSPVETAAATSLLGPDRFFAHAVHLREAEIDLLAEADAGVAHCPTANMKLASGAAPVAAMLDAGITVGIGTDGPASNNDLDLLEEMRLAALLAKLQTTDASALPARTALRMATRSGARLLGFDTGRIDVGAPADLAVVDLDAPHFTPDHDPISHLVYVANASDVRHTVCEGRILMRDRMVTVFDESAVRTEAQRRADALIARAG